MPPGNIVSLTLSKGMENVNIRFNKLRTLSKMCETLSSTTLLSTSKKNRVPLQISEGKKVHKIQHRNTQRKRNQAL